MALVVDTGPLVAALDRDDDHHAACFALLRTTTEPRVIPAPVLTEVDWWCRKRLGVDAFMDLLDDLDAGAFAVEELRRQDYRRVHELCHVYRDLQLGFVDAAVLATVERLGERKLATLDHRHFGVLQLRHVPSLELLPGRNREALISGPELGGDAVDAPVSLPS